MKRKKIYLKKLGQRGGIDIWRVDGSLIRKELDREFTNFGQHYRFPFIPEDEFWLDKEAKPNERKFFITHLLVEWDLMRRGKKYSYALEQASAKEAEERRQAGDHIKARNWIGFPSRKKIRIRLLGKAGKLSVWLVHGRLVRSIFYVDFTAGGHDLVYNFVPKKEIWIDNDIVASERPLIILHELYERQQMAHGLTYEQAHKKASELEWLCRHDNKTLKGNLADLDYRQLSRRNKK